MMHYFFKKISNIIKELMWPNIKTKKIKIKKIVIKMCFMKHIPGPK